MAARLRVTIPSSNGWRNTSSTFRRNSGSSSRNRTPPCARLTSPGRGDDPPPIRPASLTVWCGARKGRTVHSDWPGARRPATLWIRVVSSASSSVIDGRMVGRRLASMVFPAPGGPIMRMLWAPAAATSRARLAADWPRTSAKSTGFGTPSDMRAIRFTRVAGIGWLPLRWAQTSARVLAPRTSRS